MAPFDLGPEEKRAPEQRKEIGNGHCCPLSTRPINQGCIIWCREGPKAQLRVNLGPGMNSIYCVC